MGTFRRIVHKISLLSLLLLCIYIVQGTFRQVLSTYRLYRVDSDPMINWARRVEGIKEDVSVTTRILGYVTESDMPWYSLNEIDRDEEFVMTQYFLAPLILQPGLNHPLVIGNLAGEEGIVKVAEDYFGMRLISPYRGGIYLFQMLNP